MQSNPEGKTLSVLSDDGVTTHPITRDEHGNWYVTFSDGTGAVHTEAGWFMVIESESSGDDSA